MRTIGGEAVPSAQVVIVHSPSGTSATAVAAANGAFHQSGLRVGGPYEIRFSAEGFQDRTLTEVTLTPGTQPPFAAVLLPVGLEEVVATASAVTSARDLNNGVGSAYSAADIAGQPSITRDVIRTLLRDPLAQSAGEGNLSVGGVNPRFNGLAIDGSLQQDDFGLSTGTYATSRSPINLDAVESASLIASDYSVSASGFTGGLVNITTKTGTNEWDGAAFYTFHGNDQVGDTYDGSRSFTPSAFEEKEYGLSVGGPLIANKLFVFLSYDEFEAVQPWTLRRSTARTASTLGSSRHCAAWSGTSTATTPAVVPHPPPRARDPRGRSSSWTGTLATPTGHHSPTSAVLRPEHPSVRTDWRRRGSTFRWT